MRYRFAPTSPVLGAIAVLVLGACCSGPLSPEALVAWSLDPEHGFVLERSFGDLELRLRYRPLECRVITGLGDQLTPSTYDQGLADQEGTYLFDLQFKALQHSDVLDVRSEADEDYFRKQYYFTSLVDEDLQLVLGSDTLPCALAHFERTYGTAPFNTLVISFVDHGPRLVQDLRLIYNDQAFGLGRVEFLIRKEDLLELPNVKFN